MVAVAIVGAGVVGAGATAYSASQAAGAQEDAAAQANALQQGMYNQTRKDLLPYNTAGQNALTKAQGMSDTGFNFAPTEANLQQTPGYQFNMSQGLKSTQNSAAARGLGSSGAAVKGAASYATGLADSTYQNQFNNALSSWQTNYNALMGQSQLGENAAAQTGAYGTQTGSSMAQNTIGAGNAAAGAYMATGNALTSAANTIPAAMMYSNLYGSQNGLYGGTPTYGTGSLY